MASAVAGDTLQFTSAQISSYAYPDGTNFKALTALQDVQQTESPSSTQVFNDNVVQVSVRFDNNGVNSAYLTQTIGLFAKIAGGEDPILFAVVTAITPDQMPVASSVSPTALIYNIQITIQSNANISVTVNPAGTATAEDVQYIKDNYIPTSAIENDLDLLDEDPDKVLGASVGKELKSQIDALNTEINNLSAVNIAFDSSNTSIKATNVQSMLQQIDGRMQRVILTENFSSVQEVAVSAGNQGIYIVSGNKNLKEFSEINYDVTSWFAGILILFTWNDYLLIGDNGKSKILFARGGKDSNSFGHSLIL